jgi:hypothetical protein
MDGVLVCMRYWWCYMGMYYFMYMQGEPYYCANVALEACMRCGNRLAARWLRR